MPAMPTMANLAALTRDRRIVRRLAKFAFDVLEVFRSVETYIAPPSLYLDDVPAPVQDDDWDSDRDGEGSDDEYAIMN
jgi:hypothetical protein